MSLTKGCDSLLMHLDMIDIQLAGYYDNRWFFINIKGYISILLIVLYWPYIYIYITNQALSNKLHRSIQGRSMLGSTTTDEYWFHKSLFCTCVENVKDRTRGVKRGSRMKKKLCGIEFTAAVTTSPHEIATWLLNGSITFLLLSFGYQIYL